MTKFLSLQDGRVINMNLIGEVYIDHEMTEPNILWGIYDQDGNPSGLPTGRLQVMIKVGDTHMVARTFQSVDEAVDFINENFTIV